MVLQMSLLYVDSTRMMMTMMMNVFRRGEEKVGLWKKN